MFQFATPRIFRGARSARQVTVQLNAKARSSIREDQFDEPLARILGERKIGRVLHGVSLRGTAPDGVAYCEIELSLNGPADTHLDAVIAQLERLGAPKGSLMVDPAGERPDRAFGVLEGLAIYATAARLNVNGLIDRLEAALADDGVDGVLLDTWEDREDVAIYVYGARHDAIAACLDPVLAAYGAALSYRRERIA